MNKLRILPGITTMHYAMGYDDYGNCSELLAEVDRKKLENGEDVRVGTHTICDHCGMEYSMHPHVQGALYLHRGCDGRLLKL